MLTVYFYSLAMAMVRSTTTRFIYQK